METGSTAMARAKRGNAFLSLSVALISLAVGVAAVTIQLRTQNADVCRVPKETKFGSVRVTAEALSQSALGNMWWVFGYGSIMHPQKLAFSDVEPKVAVPAILKDYCLRFNTALSTDTEPVFANVEPCNGGCVHGVAYLLCNADKKTMDKSEPTYQRKAVQLQTYGGQTIPAEVYVTTETVQEKRPSDRYSKIVWCGAKLHKLLPEYVEMLGRKLFDEIPRFENVCTPTPSIRVREGELTC